MAVAGRRAMDAPRKLGRGVTSAPMAVPGDVPRPLPLDYDRNPDRFRTGRAVTNEFGLCGDVHAPVAQRLIAEVATPVLDIGCGDGALARLLSSSGQVKC